jgi:hypothetical protein
MDPFTFSFHLLISSPFYLFLVWLLFYFEVLRKFKVSALVSRALSDSFGEQQRINKIDSTT